MSVSINAPNPLITQVYMLKQEVKTNIPEETFVALPNRAPVGYDLEVRDGQSLPISVS